MDPILFVRCDEVETFGVAPAGVVVAGATFTIWEALDGEPAPDLSGVAGVVLFGSSFNVEHADEQPFIGEVRRLTLDAIDRGVPFLGVCFGAQVLAWSLGSSVTRASVREVGYEPLRPAPTAADDALLSHYSDGDMAFQWHMDTFELPPGVELLVTGDNVENQAFRLGDRVWGVQFHFEVDRPEVETWLQDFGADDSELERTWGKSAGRIREEAARHGADAERKGIETLVRFAGLAASLRR